ncbi:hypothetical protein DYB30_006718 [Aphanomyces astaci]|uniref:Uncharacterized protein n=1 Tax=Aphanomyces astaci TaxID=112090 RepID=A0A397CPF2_APHAT|nr:hypothetical protein DYB38_000096 [Aphanomyces astaci]RHY46793.1 hypothetical protein DYB30_006718 [Aphanomyces astaci]RHZ08855.1 hypothetical protein DYB31_010918 [Aphanomyces astaci]
MHRAIYWTAAHAATIATLATTDAADADEDFVVVGAAVVTALVVVAVEVVEVVAGLTMVVGPEVVTLEVMLP